MNFRAKTATCTYFDISGYHLNFRLFFHSLVFYVNLFACIGLSGFSFTEEIIVGLLNLSCAHAGQYKHSLFLLVRCSQAKWFDVLHFPHNIAPMDLACYLYYAMMYLVEYCILQVLQPVYYVGAEPLPPAKVAHRSFCLCLNLFSRQHSLFLNINWWIPAK